MSINRDLCKFIFRVLHIDFTDLYLYKNNSYAKLLNNKKIFITLFMMFFVTSFMYAMEINKLVRVRKNIIYLDDIIKTEDEEILKQSKEIQVSYSPEAGDEKEIKGSYIQIKLRQLDIPFEEIEEIDIPDTVLILREYQILDKDRIIDKMYQEFDDFYKDTDFEYKIIYNGDDEFKLPVGNVEIELDIDRFSKDRIGEFSFGTEIFVNKEKYERILNRIEVGKVVYTPVLIRDVQEGEKLTKDLIVEKRDIKTRTYSYNRSFDLDEYLGYVFRRDLKAGTELKNIHLERLKLFRRNKVVDVILKSGGITLKTTGKAKEDGYEGETVVIENQKSNQTYYGTVLKDGTVFVTIN